MAVASPMPEDVPVINTQRFVALINVSPHVVTEFQIT